MLMFFALRIDAFGLSDAETSKTNHEVTFVVVVEAVTATPVAPVVALVESGVGVASNETIVAEVYDCGHQAALPNIGITSANRPYSTVDVTCSSHVGPTGEPSPVISHILSTDVRSTIRLTIST